MHPLHWALYIFGLKTVLRSYCRLKHEPDGSRKSRAESAEVVSKHK